MIIDTLDAVVPLAKIMDFKDGSLVGRFDFFPLVPSDAKLLEVGPAHCPCFRGDRVKYFDVQDANGLRQRAIDLNVYDHSGQSPDLTPEVIHYVSEVADMSIIDDQFDLVFSSHAIEHQVDLVSHLKSVSRVLNNRGAYLVICPDRRYCFDANRSDSTIGQVIEAYQQRRKRHSLANIIDEQVYQTHNDGERHWQGENQIVTEISAKRVLDAYDLWEKAESTQSYLDRHGWFFTPPSFKMIMQCLYDMNLSDLRPVRVFNPPRPANEFIAVLVKG